MTEKPYCRRPGCDRRVKERKCQYCCLACIPREVRANALRKARANYSRTQRAKAFGAAWARLHRSGTMVTREDFFAICQELAEKFWSQGYCASEHKWVRRMGRVA
jgi:hypothetical protein